MDRYKNFNLTEICTLVRVEALEQLLKDTCYDRHEAEFVTDGFRNGFDPGYIGSMNRKDSSKNIPFTVGDKLVLWNKIMKEVRLGRFIGLYT